MTEILDSKEIKIYGDVLTSPIRFEIIKFLAKKEYPSISDIEKHLAKEDIRTSKRSPVTYPTIQKHLDYLHRKGIVYFSNVTGTYRARLLKNIRVFVEESEDIDKFLERKEKEDEIAKTQIALAKLEQRQFIEDEEKSREEAIKKFMKNQGMSRAEAEELSEAIDLKYDRKEITKTEAQEAYKTGKLKGYEPKKKKKS